MNAIHPLLRTRRPAARCAATSDPPIGQPEHRIAKGLCHIMIKTTAALVAALLTSTVAMAAGNEPVMIAQSGPWKAFYTARNNDGVPACSASTMFPNGNLLLVKWLSDMPTVIRLEMFADSWRIPNGTKLQVHVQFNRQYFSGTATGYTTRSNTGLVVGLLKGEDAKDIAYEFLEWFAGSTAMAISFPGGNEKPWQVDLTGSRAAATALLNCMAYVAKTWSPPTQPHIGGGAGTQPHVGGPPSILERPREPSYNVLPDTRPLQPKPVPTQPVRPAATPDDGSI